MGGVRALAAAGLQEPLRPCQRQQGIEEELLRLASDEAGAELAEDGMVEAWVGQFETQDIFPINTAADRIGRLAIGQPFRKLEDRGQRQARRRCGGLAARRKERRELCVVVDGAQAVSYLEVEVPARECGPGHALGVVRDRIAGVGVQGHTGTPSQQPFPVKAYAIENKRLIPYGFRKYKVNRINNICILYH